MLKGEQDAFRFTLAEAFVVRKFKGVMPALGGFPENPIQNADPLETLGTCIVQKAPVESWALLQTKVTSRDEKSALSALTPAMKFCISSGVTLKLNKFFLRGAVAEAIYRFSKNGAVTTGGAR